MLRKTLLMVLAALVAVLAFGTAYAGSAATDNLVYGYYSMRGGHNQPVPVVQETTATGCTLPNPSSKQAFTYTPVAEPVVTCDPATSKPIGVGDIAQGGSDVNITVKIGPFDEPVDVSFGLFNATFDASNIFFLNTLNQVTSLQDEFGDVSGVQGQANGKKNFKRLIPWKSSVDGVDDTILPSIDASKLPPGLYVLVLNVTRTSPANNNYDRFYRWVTYFIVPDSTQQ